MYASTAVLNAVLSDWQNDVGELVGDIVGFLGFLVVGFLVVGFLVVGFLVVGFLVVVGSLVVGFLE